MRAFSQIRHISIRASVSRQCVAAARALFLKSIAACFVLSAHLTSNHEAESGRLSTLGTQWPRTVLGYWSLKADMTADFQSEWAHTISMLLNARELKSATQTLDSCSGSPSVVCLQSEKPHTDHNMQTSPSTMCSTFSMAALSVYITGFDKTAETGIRLCVAALLHQQSASSCSPPLGLPPPYHP